MSSGGERHSGDCVHGNLYDWCRKDGPCRIEELEREVARLRAERDKPFTSTPTEKAHQ